MFETPGVYQNKSIEGSTSELEAFTSMSTIPPLVHAVEVQVETVTPQRAFEMFMGKTNDNLTLGRFKFESMTCNSPFFFVF